MKINNKWINFGLVLVALILLNIGGKYIFHRFDFTADKRFTLSDKTKKLLKGTEKPIIITVFLNGELPAAFKRLQASVKDLLTDYKAYSNTDLKVVFIDPLAGFNTADQDTVINNLYQQGIEATNLSVKTENGLTQKLVFPMAMVESDGKQMPVKLFQNLDAGGSYEDNINRSIENLEYIFTSSIKKVIGGNNPRIGFTESNAEPSDLQLYDAMHTLANSYEVGRVNLNTIDKAGLDKLKMLIVVKPQTAFTEAEKYKINYFVMNGGRVLWSIDQISAELDSLRGKGSQMVLNKNLNLDDMLFMYGARINYNVIADKNSAEIPVSTGNVGGQPQIQLVPWLYYPILLPDTAASLVKNLDGIKSEFPSTVDTIGSKGIKKTYILTTSAFNRVFNVPKQFSLQMVAEQPDPKTFQNPMQSAGVLLEGNFQSVFAGRPLPAGISTPFTNVAVGKPSKMVVIGDGDLFKNQVVAKDNSPLPLGFDRYTQRTYGNKALLLNIVDYFTDDDNLIALRNKDVKIRLLDKAKIKLEKTKWQVLNIIVPLLLLILFAIFQHYYRKYKYAK
ncbi:gliding motility-associated ABC transporter substrate-binding protein GldG [Pedobacter ginsengiterrae]|uniref:Gliding motility-associated ABC transporter substrate-binding protein GldG n=1 Tax=Pedobacter ginsengiterrae TaxID=871696 RepID=A0ABP7NVW0_9SPHI